MDHRFQNNPYNGLHYGIEMVRMVSYTFRKMIFEFQTQYNLENHMIYVIYVFDIFQGHKLWAQNFCGKRKSSL